MPVRSPVAGCPVSNSVHQPDPEEAESTAASAAVSAAASGTGGRPRGAPVRGSKKKRSPRSAPPPFKMTGCKLIDHNAPFIFVSLLSFSP